MVYKPTVGEWNEAGVAAGWIMIMAFLIIAGICYVYYLSLLNNIVNGPNNDQSIGINHDIKQGTVSTQSANASGFGMLLAQSIPLFIIIGVFVWGVNRAITVKQVG